MKNLLLICLFGLLVSCNENKTTQNEDSGTMSNGTSSPGTSSTSQSNGLSSSERDSVAVDHTSKSGASSITPEKDSVRHRH